MTDNRLTDYRQPLRPHVPETPARARTDFVSVHKILSRFRPIWRPQQIFSSIERRASATHKKCVHNQSNDSM